MRDFNVADDKNLANSSRVMLPSEEPWYVSLWRPAMAWMYMGICVFDFVLGPFFYAWFAWYTKDFAKFGEWQPLTLQGGGLFHAAMGGILGVSSWSRGRENLEKYKLYQDEIVAGCPPTPPQPPAETTVTVTTSKVQDRLNRYRR